MGAPLLLPGDIALLQRIGSGQGKPGEPGVDDLVRRLLAEVVEKTGKPPVVVLSAYGRRALRESRESATPRMRTPTMGKARSVLYVPAPHKERAALIVDVQKNGVANLIVFGTSPADERMVDLGEPVAVGSAMMSFVSAVPYNANPAMPGTWHWMADSAVHYPSPAGASIQTQPISEA